MQDGHQDRLNSPLFSIMNLIKKNTLFLSDQHCQLPVEGEAPLSYSGAVCNSHTGGRKDI